MQSESLTTNARLSSEDPCAIIITLAFTLCAAENTLDATPTVPLIPEPITATIETLGVASIFLTVFPNRFISSEVTAFSRSDFLTINERLDSDGLEETISTLTFFSASVVNIFAAVPGAANVIPPLRSIRPMFRIADTHFTVLFVLAEGDAVTIVPVFVKSASNPHGNFF